MDEVIAVEKAMLVRMMELAGMSYSASNPPLGGVIQVIDDGPTGVQCVLRRWGTRLSVVFRGSDALIDWAHNLRFCKKVIPYGNTASPIRVHGGFLDAYKAPQIRLAIRRAVTADIRQVDLTGHSYGAALALLCAVDLQYHFPTLDYTVALFGCPRVGNRAFRASYDRRVFKTVRVEYGNDIVTRLPFAWMGFRHVGARLHLGPPRLPFFPSLDDHRPQRYLAALLARLPG